MASWNVNNVKFHLVAVACFTTINSLIRTFIANLLRACNVHLLQVKDIPMTDENSKYLSPNDDISINSKSFDDYVQRMSQKGQWGDGIMLACASTLYNRQINVLLADGAVINFQPQQQNQKLLTDKSGLWQPPLALGFVSSVGATSPNHYIYLQHKKYKTLSSVPASPQHVCSEGMWNFGM